MSYYTIALLHDPRTPRDVLIKRNKALVASESWEQALDDANQVDHFDLIWVDPVYTSLSGDLAQPVIAVGIRAEAFSFTHGRRTR